MTNDMKTKPQILIDAENNWPEDEASLAHEIYAARVADGDAEWAESCLRGDVQRMTKRVFATESDCAELTARYLAELKRLGVPERLLS